MTAHAAQDLAGFPAFSARGDRYVCVHQITIGASGAITAESVDDAKFDATYSTTGTYTLVFPPCRGGSIVFTVKSAAGTVTHAYFTALSFTAGTATFKTSSVSAVADPANGDIITLTYFLDATLL